MNLIFLLVLTLVNFAFGMEDANVEALFYKVNYQNEFEDYVKLNNISLNYYVGFKDRYGNSLLMKAIAAGCKSNVSLLVKYFDLQEERNFKGDIPFTQACKLASHEIAEVLLQNGANVNAQDGLGYTGLMWSILSNNKAMVNFLLDRGANIAPAALSLAKHLKRVEIIEILNKYINIKRNRKLFFKAIMIGNLDLVMEALPKIDINFRDKFNNTPLIIAAYYGYEEIVKLLINVGADVNAFNNDNKTALTHAIDRGHKKIEKILRKASLAQLIDIYSSRSKNVLMFACYHGQLQMVQHAIDAKNEDVNAINNLGCTALTYAVVKNHSDIVKVLIKAGADIHKPDTCGRTAFDWANIFESNEVLAVLKQADEELILKPIELTEVPHQKNIDLDEDFLNSDDYDLGSADFDHIEKENFFDNFELIFNQTQDEMLNNAADRAIECRTSNSMPIVASLREITVPDFSSSYTDDEKLVDQEDQSDDSSEPTILLTGDSELSDLSDMEPDPDANSNNFENLYSCTTCNKSFNSKAELKMHREDCKKPKSDTNQEKKAYKKPEVVVVKNKSKNIFFDEVLLKKRYFYCPKCKFKTIVQEKLNEHNENVVHLKNGLLCKECGFRAKNYKDIRDHQIQEHKFVCDDCMHNCGSKKKLVKHKKTEHPGMPIHYRCQTQSCKRYFLTIKELERHKKIKRH